MMNGCDENTEALVAERDERAKKLYRYISDIARTIDEATATCQTIPNLFKTSLEVKRQKLREHCVKLLFLDPINYGKKALELLWRKVYYETVSKAKKLRENEEQYDNYLFTHIMSGIGQFHYMIERFQSEIKLQIKEIDYIPLHNDDALELKHELTLEQLGRYCVHSCLIYLGDLSRYQAEVFHTFDQSIAARYYQQAAQINLTSGMPYNQLGNLYMDKNHNLTSACYYIRCMSSVTPFEGAVGNLTKLFEKNAQLAESISGSTHIQSQQEHIQGTISKFLSLIEIWYFGKEDADIPQRCNVIAQDLRMAMDWEKVVPPEDINKNYEQFMQELEAEEINPSYLNNNIIHEIVEICIFTVAKVADTDEKRAFAVKAFTLALLSQLLYKLLQELQSFGLKNPASKYKSHYSSVQDVQVEQVEIQNVVEATEEVSPVTNGNHEDKISAENSDDDDDADVIVIDEKDEIVNKENDPEKTNGKLKTKRRRRRRIASNSDLSDDSGSSGVDSNESGMENEESDSSYQSDSQTDVSDCDTKDEPDAMNNNEVKTPEQALTNGDNVSNDKLDQLDANKIQNFLRGANFLPSLKLLQDWVLKEKDLILSCGESGESLFQCIVDLLNIMEYNFTFKHKINEACSVLEYAKCLSKNLELEHRTIPLPEDVNLRGTNICKFDTNAAEWNILKQYKPSVYEENVIRILNFIDFGEQIANIVPKIRYNMTMQVHYFKKSSPPKLAAKVNLKKTREWYNSKTPQVQNDGTETGLLRRMGKLWLAARVRELELEKCGRVAPTLLAVDATALTAHLKRVKLLIKTRTFIVLIPTVVLQELDDVKRDQIAARDAIRWLETQLQTGSRYLRAQKSGQTRSLPLLKYPKKAPQHVYNFIKILEFCYHFVAEEKPQDSDNNKNASMLMLLTGNDRTSIEEQYKEFSLTGAATSAGISLESITTFYAKWRLSIQKNGKKG